MMRHELRPLVDLSQRIYTLRHIETGEYICLRQDKTEYVACFTDGDTAGQFQEELGLIEYVDITPMRLGETPFDHYWLDGEMIGRGALADDSAIYN